MAGCARIATPGRRVVTARGRGLGRKRLDAAAGLLDRRDRALRRAADLEIRPWPSVRPLPRIFTPSRGARPRRPSTSASTVIGSAASSLPASIALWMRPRLTSLRSSGDGGVKPRLGRRRCSGIWPPSKPLMRTPERAVWPLPPRPACLPLPEPMPRPTRMRAFVEPAIVLDVVEFHGRDPLLAVDDAHEVRDLGDHAAVGRRVGDARACGRSC